MRGPVRIGENVDTSIALTDDQKALADTAAERPAKRDVRGAAPENKRNQIGECILVLPRDPVIE